MTTTPARATGTWARCGDVLSSATATGTVAIPPGGRAAVALSGVDHAVWAALAEPGAADGLATRFGDEDVRRALVALAGLGLLREVD